MRSSPGPSFRNAHLRHGYRSGFDLQGWIKGFLSAPEGAGFNHTTVLSSSTQFPGCQAGPPLPLLHHQGWCQTLFPLFHMRPLQTHVVAGWSPCHHLQPPSVQARRHRRPRTTVPWMHRWPSCWDIRGAGTPLTQWGCSQMQGSCRCWGRGYEDSPRESSAALPW